MIQRRSSDDVATTVERIQAALAERGIPVFAVIDHAAGARQLGLTLDDEVLLVYGNAAVGTALMQADARAGLDLPLRMLVWSESGLTQIGYHDPAELADAYRLDGQQSVLERLSTVQATIAAAGVGHGG